VRESDERARGWRALETDDYEINEHLAGQRGSHRPARMHALAYFRYFAPPSGSWSFSSWSTSWKKESDYFYAEALRVQD
jgi:hypothetical protein